MRGSLACLDFGNAPKVDIKIARDLLNLITAFQA